MLVTQKHSFRWGKTRIFHQKWSQRETNFKLEETWGNRSWCANATCASFFVFHRWSQISQSAQQNGVAFFCHSNSAKATRCLHSPRTYTCQRQISWWWDRQNASRFDCRNLVVNLFDAFGNGLRLLRAKIWIWKLHYIIAPVSEHVNHYALRLSALIKT